MVVHNFCVLLAIFHFSHLIVSAEWNTQDYLKREHSLIRPYQGSGVGIPYWDFLGNTMVTGNFIRLTPDLQSKMGGLWNNAPCYMKSWELQIQFKVHGKGKEPLYGDGFAIWYTKDRLQLGPVFGNRDYFTGLAIFADTYSNHNGPHDHGHPYVSAMVNNGTLHYDHDRDGTHTELAGCTRKFRNQDHDTYISIRYERDTIKVSTDVDGKKGWAECFEVKGVRLPTGYYFGFSATTGQLSDNHDIIGVKLYEIEVPDDDTPKEDRSQILPEASYFSPPRDHVEDAKPSSMSGLKLFAIIMCALVGLVLCIVVGVMVFQKNNQTSRKRFY